MDELVQFGSGGSFLPLKSGGCCCHCVSILHHNPNFLIPKLRLPIPMPLSHLALLPLLLPPWKRNDIAHAPRPPQTPNRRTPIRQPYSRRYPNVRLHPIEPRVPCHLQPSPPFAIPSAIITLPNRICSVPYTPLPLYLL